MNISPDFFHFGVYNQHHLSSHISCGNSTPGPTNKLSQAYEELKRSLSLSIYPSLFTLTRSSSYPGMVSQAGHQAAGAAVSECGSAGGSVMSPAFL